MAIYQYGGEQCKTIVDIFRRDVIVEIQWNRIQQVEIHRIIREHNLWNLVNTSVLQPKFGDEKVVSKGIAVNRWNRP